jgi:transposase InsO family protein
MFCARRCKDLPSSYELADRELSVLIREIFYQSNERFGRNPIKYKLQERGYQVSKMRISRLMKEMGLQVKVAPYTLEHKKSLSRNKLRNLIRGEFSAEAPNLVWASDITYVKVKDQYMFVCVVIDLFSRKILSYGISDTIDTVLTMNTFDEAFEERGKPENLIFHSDQGAQYTSYAFRTHFEELQCRQSFSAPGYPYDNSVCESFFNTLKKKRFIITFTILPPSLRLCLMNISSITTKSECTEQ